jgi:hypothetical protein
MAFRGLHTQAFLQLLLKLLGREQPFQTIDDRAIIVDEVDPWFTLDAKGLGAGRCLPASSAYS